MAHELSQPVPTGEVTTAIRNGNLVVNETFEYIITADTINPTNASLLTTPDLPVVGQTYTALGQCTQVSIKRIPGNRLLHRATCTFSSDADNINGGGYSGDPETWTPIRETILEPYEEVELADRDGYPYLNGAGTPFASAPAQPKDNIRWDFWQYESASVTDETVADRNNTMNNAPYKGRAKHTLLLKVRRSVIGAFRGATRRITEYSLIWKATDWNDKIANQGNSFVSGGRVWPYRYHVVDSGGNFMFNESQVIHTGPLGSRNVPVNSAYTAADGQPTGGTIAVNGSVYAVRPSVPILYFISRRKYNELDFSTFLRI